MRKIFIFILLLTIGSTAHGQNTVAEWLKEAKLKITNSEWAEAKNCCDSAIKLDPQNAKAYLLGGKALQQGEIWQPRHSGVGYFSVAISLDSTLTEAYYLRANALYTNEEFKKCIPDFDRCIPLLPPLLQTDAYCNRGFAKYRLGLYKEAIFDFDQYLKYAPNFSFFHFYRGICKSRAGHYLDAIDDFNKIMGKFPTIRNINAELGYAYFKLGRTREDYECAISNYDEEIRLYNTRIGFEPLYRDSAVKALQKLVTNAQPGYIEKKPADIPLRFDIFWIEPTSKPDTIYDYTQPNPQMRLIFVIQSNRPIMKNYFLLKLNGKNIPRTMQPYRPDSYSLEKSMISGPHPQGAWYQYNYTTKITLLPGSNHVKLQYQNFTSAELKINFQPQNNPF